MSDVQACPVCNRAEVVACGDEIMRRWKQCIDERDALRAEVADLKWQRDGAVDQAAALLVERDELRDALAALLTDEHADDLVAVVRGWDADAIRRVLDRHNAALVALKRDTTQDNNTWPGKPNG